MTVEAVGPAGRGDASNSSRMCGSRDGNEVNKRKSDTRIKVKRKHTARMFREGQEFLLSHN